MVKAAGDTNSLKLVKALAAAAGQVRSSHRLPDLPVTTVATTELKIHRATEASCGRQHAISSDFHATRSWQQFGYDVCQLHHQFFHIDLV